MTRRSPAIASYKARGSKGDYYDYYKLVRGKNEALIHLGNEDNEWVKIFREAIARRQQLDDLIAQRTRLYAEIATLEAALFPNRHSPT